MIATDRMRLSKSRGRAIRAAEWPKPLGARAQEHYVPCVEPRLSFGHEGPGLLELEPCELAEVPQLRAEEIAGGVRFTQLVHLARTLVFDEHVVVHVHQVVV